MTALDMIVLLLVLGGLVTGYLRGFVAEVLSLLIWVVAIGALKLVHAPLTELLTARIGTWAGAAVLAFALILGVVVIGGKLLVRQIGSATRRSVVGPVDRVLGAGFGALKGLVGATLLFLGANLVYDIYSGREAERPQWMANSRTYPLLQASGRAVVDFVHARRGDTADENRLQPQTAPANVQIDEPEPPKRPARHRSK
jgi:membrane protein required for colicin V production